MRQFEHLTHSSPPTKIAVFQTCRLGLSRLIDFKDLPNSNRRRLYQHHAKRIVDDETKDRSDCFAGLPGCSCSWEQLESFGGIDSSGKVEQDPAERSCAG